MEIRKCGRTDLELSRLSLGCLYLSALGTGELEDAKEAMYYALNKGVNFIDTAPSYQDSEQVLGQALKDYDGKMPMISTKIGMPPPFNPQSRQDILNSVEKSMSDIGCDVIDLLYIHEPERKGQMEWFTDYNTYSGPVLEALEEMKQKGWVKWIGVGGTTAHEMAKVIDTGMFDVVQTAFNYSLLWQEARYEIFPTAKKHGLGIICSAPLQQGSLAVRHDDLIENGAPWISKPRREQFKALYSFLDELGMSIVELALRFVLSNDDVDCVLVGAKNRKEISETLAYSEKGALPADILKRIEEIYMMVPFRPTLEPILLPWGNERPPIGWIV